MKKTHELRVPLAFVAICILAVGFRPAKAASQVRPEAYVSVARELASELGERNRPRFVCVSPRLTEPGNSLMPEEVRGALEAEGWTFYDLDFPADTSVVLVSFSEAEDDQGIIRLRAGFQGIYVTLESRRVSFWTERAQYEAECASKGCTVRKDPRRMFTDGVLSDPEKFLAGQAGKCTGTIPGRGPGVRNHGPSQ